MPMRASPIARNSQRSTALDPDQVQGSNWDHDSIMQQYGPQGLTEPPREALYTDDTQLVMATARVRRANTGI